MITVNEEVVSPMIHKVFKQPESCLIFQFETLDCTLQNNQLARINGKDMLIILTADWCMKHFKIAPRRKGNCEYC